MKATKKTDKANFMPKDLGDFLNDSQFLKNSPQTKKTQKRQPTSDNTDEEDISKLIGEYQQAKKMKLEKISGDHKESRQKLLESMERQMKARKQGTNNLLSSLSELIQQQEADYNMLAENEKKLEYLVGAFLKCIQQSTAAARENAKALRDIFDAFKNDADEMESKHKTETEKLADQLEEDMNKLQQKIVTETKRKQLENLRKTIFHAFYAYEK